MREHGVIGRSSIMRGQDDIREALDQLELVFDLAALVGALLLGPVAWSDSCRFLTID